MRAACSATRASTRTRLVHLPCLRAKQPRVLQKPQRLLQPEAGAHPRRLPRPAALDAKLKCQLAAASRPAPRRLPAFSVVQTSRHVALRSGPVVTLPAPCCARSSTAACIADSCAANVCVPRSVSLHRSTSASLDPTALHVVWHRALCRLSGCAVLCAGQGLADARHAQVCDGCVVESMYGRLSALCRCDRREQPLLSM